MKNLILLTALAFSTMFIACEQQELITDAEFADITETSIQLADLSNDTDATGIARNMDLSYTLYAGQDIEAGQVTVIVNEAAGVVKVTYTTNDNWVLGATHLYAGACGEIPMTASGNPRIGHFPYTTTGELAEREASYNLLLADIIDKDGQLGSVAGCFCLAAHAELLKASSSDDDEGEEEETGWADWTIEFDGSRWGGYNEVCL